MIDRCLPKQGEWILRPMHQGKAENIRLDSSSRHFCRASTKTTHLTVDPDRFVAVKSTGRGIICFVDGRYLKDGQLPGDWIALRVVSVDPSGQSCIVRVIHGAIAKLAKYYRVDPSGG